MIRSTLAETVVNILNTNYPLYDLAVIAKSPNTVTSHLSAYLNFGKLVSEYSSKNNSSIISSAFFELIIDEYNELIKKIGLSNIDDEFDLPANICENISVKYMNIVKEISSTLINLGKIKDPTIKLYVNDNIKNKLATVKNDNNSAYFDFIQNAKKEYDVKDSNNSTLDPKDFVEFYFEEISFDTTSFINHVNGITYELRKFDDKFNIPCTLLAKPYKLTAKTRALNKLLQKALSVNNNNIDNNVTTLLKFVYTADKNNEIQAIKILESIAEHICEIKDGKDYSSINPIETQLDISSILHDENIRITLCKYIANLIYKSENKMKPTLINIAHRFNILYDKCDRESILRAISLLYLVLGVEMTSRQQIIALWLLYAEYKDVPFNNHPYKSIFQCCLNEVNSELLEPCDSNINDVRLFVILLYKYDIKPFLDFEPDEFLNNRIKKIIPKVENDTADLKLKNDTKYKYVLEKMMNETIIEHQVVFLESLLIKMFELSMQQSEENTNFSHSISQREIISAIIANKVEKRFFLLPTILSNTKKNYKRKEIIRTLISIIPYLKSNLVKAFAPFFFFFELSEDVVDEFIDEMYSPIIYFYFLKPDENNMINIFSLDDSIKCLSNYPIFEIMDDWIDTIKSTFCKDVSTIIFLYIQNLLYFLYLILERDSFHSLKIINYNILPILSKCVVKERPMPFTNDEFMDLALICYKKFTTSSYNRLQNLLPFMSAICVNLEMAELIRDFFNKDTNIFDTSINSTIYTNNTNTNTMTNTKKSITKPNIFGLLFINAEKSILSTNLNSDEFKNDLNLVILFQRLSKHFTDENKSKLFLMISGNFTKTHDVTEQYRLIIKFISEFLWFPPFAVYGAKIIKNLISSNQSAKITIIKYLDELLKSRFTNIISIIETTNNDDGIIMSFIKIARQIVLTVFQYKSSFEKLPKFAPFILIENFSRIVHRKFQSKYEKWHILTTLLDSTILFVKTNKEYIKIIHEEPDIISAILTIIGVSAHVLSPSNDSSSSNSSIHFDRTDITYAVRCQTAALSFLHTILVSYLNTNDDLSPLCRIFFDEKSEASSIISIMIGFQQLRVPSSLGLLAEPDDVKYAGLALKIIELLCKIAAKLECVSVDAFYSHKRHKILVDCINKSTTTNKSLSQIVDILNFVSSTLETQPAFAFSFINSIDESYIMIDKYLMFAGQKFESEHKSKNVLNVESKLLLSIIKVYSLMWQKLNNKSKVLEKISQYYSYSLYTFIINNPPQVSGVFEYNSFNDFYNYKLDRANYLLTMKYFLVAMYRQEYFKTKQKILKGTTKAFDINKHMYKMHLTKMFIYAAENLKYSLLDIKNDKGTLNGIDPNYINDDMFKSFDSSYGTEFYYDTLLTDHYFNNTKLCFVLKKYNLCLSQIDAATEIINILTFYINIYTKNINKKTDDVIEVSSEIFPRPKDVMLLFFDILKSNQVSLFMMPEKTVIAVSNLLISIVNSSIEVDRFNFITSQLISRVNEYFKYRSTNDVFKVLILLFKTTNPILSTEANDDYINDLRTLFSKCFDVLNNEKTTDKITPLLCAQEIAYHVNDLDNFLDENMLNLLMNTIDKVAFDENIGPEFYQLIDILCQNDIFNEKIYNFGIAEKLCVTFPKESKLWIPMLKFFNSLPLTTDFVKSFVIGSLPVLINIMNDYKNPAEMLLWITSLIIRMSGSFESICNKYPNTFYSLMQLIYNKMKKCYSLAKSNINIRNLSKLYFEVVRNCLIIFNLQIDFMNDEVAVISDTRENRFSTLKYMKNIMNETPQNALFNTEDITEELQELCTIIVEASERIYKKILKCSELKNEFLENENN